MAGSQGMIRGVNFTPSQVPDHATWMRSTEKFARKRSAELKALDDAIKARRPASVITAFDAWIAAQQAKEGDWRKSVRNESGAITALWRAINGGAGTMSEQEKAALAFVRQEQNKAIRTQFANKQLTLKTSSLAGLISGSSTGWQKTKTLLPAGVTGASFVNSASSVGSAVQSVLSQISKHGIDVNMALRMLLLPDQMTFIKTISSCTGQIAAGGKFALALKSVASLAWKRHKLSDGHNAIAVRMDPQMAFDAVQRLLIAEHRAEGARAGVAGANFGARVGFTFLDGGAVSGPAMSILQAVIDLVWYIVNLSRDLDEIDKTNAVLRSGVYNWSLFNHSPLLGCYYLLMQDHSTIVAGAMEQFGSVRWQDDVERLMPKVNGVLDAARMLVGTSRFEIREFSGLYQKAKGIPEMKFSQQDKIGKLAGGTDALWNKIDRGIQRKLDSSLAPPNMDGEEIRARQNANAIYSNLVKTQSSEFWTGAEEFLGPMADRW